MLVRRRIHSGQVYLGREVMKVLGVKDGDIVEVEVREGEAVIRSVKSTDKSTLEMLKILKETKAYGGYEDFLKSIIMRMLMDSYKNIIH